MVVRIRTGKSIRGALSYNEQKVKSGKAEMILASRFGCEINSLGFTEKLNRFERLNNRSQKVKTNTIHLSLNFSPYDQIDTEKMQAIAIDYMSRIGFGNQPFLVYRHMDTNHPHMHIVASVIRLNGRPIDLHNIGKLKSEPARKAIENEFSLLPAESIKNEKEQHQARETKQSISNVVNEVIRSYHFTNLEEFNLILKQHLIVADPGLPGTRMHLNNGLVYSNCDHNGNKIGIAIKASSIFNSPTLKVLHEKFEKEKSNKQKYSSHTAQALGEILNTPGQLTEPQFRIRLVKRGIRCHFEKNDLGLLTDVKFVDNRKKVVLTCSDLQVSIEELAGKIILPPYDFKKAVSKSILKRRQSKIQQAILSDTALKLLQTLIQPEYEQSGQIPEFMRKKKKKRRPRY